MERVRSLSLQDREEALTESHLIPLITERVVQQLMAQLIADYVKDAGKASRQRKSPHKTEINKSNQKPKIIKENRRTASTKELYISKATSIKKKVSVTEIEKTPLAAQLALEK